MTATAPAIAAASLQTVPLANLREHPDNPRKHFDPAQLAELAASIKAKGVINPLLVRWQGPQRPGDYQILAGARRFRAAKLADVDQVPVLVRDLDDAAALELMVTDNQQRTDVHPLEEAQGYHLLMTKAKLDVARIAEKIGLSVKYVYDRVKLLSLTKEAQAAFLAGDFTAGHAVILARLKPQEQARAMKAAGALFTAEQTLWDPTSGEPRYAGRESRKPVSVREFQAWVDKYTRFDAAAADPMLFPKTAEVLTEAREEAEKIVPITYDHYVPPEAKDGTRTFGPQSWARADGTLKSKTCDHSVIGVVVVGPGRGEAFKVCVDKKKCPQHWGSEQRAAKKRVQAATEGGTTGEDRYAIERRKQEEEHKREEAARERWKKAAPAILEAIAERVKKMPTGTRGLLGQILLGAVTPYGGTRGAESHVPPGSSAEDLVRHAVFIVLFREATDAWRAPREFPKRAKAFGIDVKKILDQAAPVEKPKPAPTKAAAAKPAKKAGRARASA